jgi:carboxyl-terminal processing protease
VTAEEIEEDIVYVKLYSFSSNSGSEFIEVVDRFLDAETVGIIVDIRDNPGGVVRECVQITSQFLAEGDDVLHQVDGNFKIQNTDSSIRSELEIKPDVRVAILQNDRSASASEIFAGALQDLRQNSAIIGTSSFGKGSVNYIRELMDGSALIITFSYWTTPNGRYIAESKIMPDIAVDDEEALMDAALSYIKNI